MKCVLLIPIKRLARRKVGKGRDKPEGQEPGSIHLETSKSCFDVSSIIQVGIIHF